jgi:leucyl-tRNA synthetase
MNNKGVNQTHLDSNMLNNQISQKFDHKTVEAKWQKTWVEKTQDEVDIKDAKRPFYNLMMFPYPSAEGLHVGNMYAFTGSDIYGRFKKMQGFDVFEPIGLDGFGIHSENFALKIGRHPIDHASITQNNYYIQLHKIGAMFDWSRTLETYSPNYYQWTQWLFIQMFKRGLAVRKKASVNWCPSCKTVLADEQVIDGKCERCGNAVIKKPLEQWFFRITAYAEKLLENIPALDWSEKVKTAQTNWIGKKKGINIKYPVVDPSGQEVGELVCFTTRPDTNFGATFVVLAPEHPFINKLLTLLGNKDVDRITQYLKNSQKKSEQERGVMNNKKTGVNTGFFCVNPLNQTKIPIFISDFVLSNFGTGAVVGVPAHDERDFDFAREFNLPIKKVIDFNSELHVIINKQFVLEKLINNLKKDATFFEQKNDLIKIVTDASTGQKIISMIAESFRETSENIRKQKEVKSDAFRKQIISEPYAEVDGIYKGIVTASGLITDLNQIKNFATNESIPAETLSLLNPGNYKFCFSGDGVCINSEFLDGLKTDTAIVRMIDYLEDQGWGEVATTWHLRDWLISRQRYWGPPIPMIYCETCAKKGQSWFTSIEGQNYQSMTMSANKKGEDSDGINNEHFIGNISKLSISDKNVTQMGKRDSMSDNAGWYPVLDNELPVILPRIEDYKPGSDGVAPLSKHREFYETKCPGCGGKAVRETDVSDTFLDSSWYFLKYPSITKEDADIANKNFDSISTPSRNDMQISISKNSLGNETSQNFVSTSSSKKNNSIANSQPFDPEITKRWLPVHMYTGGAEHSVLHLLYSRFVTMVLHDMGLINFEEPFTKFFAHGLVIKDGAKMSKSKGNVVNPDEYIEMYGSDALRIYLMFMGPFSEGGDFRDTAMEGMSKWVGRIWTMATASIKLAENAKDDITENNEKSIEKALSRLVKKVGEDSEKRRYNTAIAAMMEFTNLVGSLGGTISHGALRKFLLILSPYAPYLSEELWQMLSKRDIKDFSPENSVHHQAWPDFSPNDLVDDEVAVIVQVNGKLREKITAVVDKAKDKAYIQSKAESAEKVKQYLIGKNLVKVIFVPGKLINFVVN